MLNLRKLKQDFSSNVLKDGKQLFATNRVLSAKILHLDAKTLRISAQVMGQYKNAYESEIEIDRQESETIDSNCDCPYHYDCQHLAAVLFYLEAYLDEILVKYSKENDLDHLAEKRGFDEQEKKKLLEALKEAESKEEQRKDEEYQKGVLNEYVGAAHILGKSPFFLPDLEKKVEQAELAIIHSFPKKKGKNDVEIQVALRLPARSKPLNIPNVFAFFDAVRYKEIFVIGNKAHLFSIESFGEKERPIARLIMDHLRLPENSTKESAFKSGCLSLAVFGMVLAKAQEIASSSLERQAWSGVKRESLTLPCLYENNLESPTCFSKASVQIKVTLEFIHPPTTKILLNPTLVVDETSILLEDALFFECAKPGIIYNHTYYRFEKQITRQHLRSFFPIREMTIPEPLFGTFVENALPELSRFAEVDYQGVTELFATLPFAGSLEAVCDILFLNGELEASLSFIYDGKVVPSSLKVLDYGSIRNFVTKEGVMARDLVEEQKITQALFCDFFFDQESQTYVAKTDRKIIEFMTDVVPRNQHRVTFNCPKNLLDQFIYDQTNFKLELSDLRRMDIYEIKLEVEGALRGVKLDQIWDCLVSRRAYLELDNREKSTKGRKDKAKLPKILVLDLSKIGEVIQLFDEMGIEQLDNISIKRPLWSLANIDETNFEGLPVSFKMSDRLKEICKQMLGEKEFKFSPIPSEIKAELRNYQKEGVNWLERLRMMYFDGILADDMGLGKTLQAIVALTQHLKRAKEPSLVVCPTSLLYNWDEECHKFNPKLKTLIIDGMPHQRKRLMARVNQSHVVITSYSLLQKDIELYNSFSFSYMILDEAQHIKNRGTRNAKSVKMIRAAHRLVLSGTPIENSLEELWSLFDFLMPGFLGSYERFVEKYVRLSGKEHIKNLHYLRKKVSPFILRRMKADVLSDLPPVSENIYHTQLSDMQKELYRSYAASARDELVKLVARDGFEKIQIHVLATLTRLKQICCHPAIFAKEKAEPGDSAKYDLLLELLQTLIEGKHKTVIFSQYTRMLHIMRSDFEKRGIQFEYLDGSSKNRLEIVKRFNEEPTISVFLVSLKAGGTGLNLVGADTVIHYDMWWNPAVENQATDRVHRIGQKGSVSVYKLVTLGTIEEKIVEMQNCKRGIVKKIVSCDDEAMTKLTWEDVLELLQT